jgi:hypothetical protein
MNDLEMGSRLKLGVIHIHGLMSFRELLNWINEKDLCFYLNRLDKLLTKIGPPQTALAWIRTPLVDWKRLLHICYPQRTKFLQ